MRPIDYGMFIMPYHPYDKPQEQCHDEDLELIVRCEELGFSEFWIGEHHTMKFESIVMPEIFIGHALGRTNSIRLGPAPVCLNQHHPGQVAARLAFLDHLSKGRLNLCFGPSSVSTDMELCGVDPKAGGAMVEEAINIILALWASDPPYEIDGKFWKIRLAEHIDEETGLGYIRKPRQQPHPPIAMPAISRNSGSMKIAGNKGFQPFSAQLVTANVLADNWSTYERAAQEAGRGPDRGDWKITRSIFLADTTREAVERARTNSLGHNFDYVNRVLEKLTGSRKVLKRDLEMPDSECDLDYLMREQIIAGDVDECLRRLLSMVEETGEFGTLVLISYDWDDKESWIRSLELFANELMPALNKAVAS
jgi:alkanesulfonate monooxygenase SsuD/methylene tetrahydromethanopterin reductase-like flavin-dependent oxidoreductase (luciferase family)